MSLELYYPGLEGVCVGETNISTSEHGGLYRGYSVMRLAEETTFLEVAHLFINGDLPSLDQFADFCSILADEMNLPSSFETILNEIPMHVPVMDVLRTGSSLLAHYDSQISDIDAESSFSKSIRILARIPLILSVRYRSHRGWNHVPFEQELSFARNLLYHLTDQEPSLLQEKALDTALILNAGREFQSTDFVARLVVSTDADLYAAITAAIGAAQGPQSISVVETISDELDQINSPLAAENWVRWQLKESETIPGFRKANSNETGLEPMVRLLKSYCERLAVESDDLEREEVAESIERIAKVEANLVPTTDWMTARLYRYLGLMPDVFASVSLLGRLAGWCAHIIEQQEEHCRFKPQARYRGALNQDFTPLSERG